jgi:hypothetical protein
MGKGRERFKNVTRKSATGCRDTRFKRAPASRSAFPPVRPYFQGTVKAHLPTLSCVIRFYCVRSPAPFPW